MRNHNRYKVIDYLGVKFVNPGDGKYIVFSRTHSRSDIRWRRYRADGIVEEQGVVYNDYSWRTLYVPEEEVTQERVMLSAASPEVRAAYENYKTTI